MNELEEDRADVVLREDLQQLALLGLRVGVDQDLVLGQARHVLAVVRNAQVDHVEVAVRRIEERHALGAHGFHRVVDVVGEAGDVLDAFAVIRVEIFVDLRLRIARLIERNAHDAIRRGHRLGHQAGLGALDVEVADLTEVEQALVIVRPLLHVAEEEVMREMVDEGEPEAGRILIGARDRLVIAVVDAALIAVTVDEIQHAVANALHHRRIHGLGGCLLGDRFAAVAEHGGQHLGGGLLETNGETGRARTMRLGEIGGERIGVFIDQEIHATLAVHRDGSRFVFQYRGEAHVAEQRMQLGAATRRCGEFDEFEAVDTHGVFEGGDLHAKIGLCTHGNLLTD